MLSKSESQRAFADAIELVKRIMVEVKKQNPQLSLKINLKDKGSSTG